jgi:hypothetical protein
VWPASQSFHKGTDTKMLTAALFVTARTGTGHTGFSENVWMLAPDDAGCTGHLQLCNRVGGSCMARGKEGVT